MEKGQILARSSEISSETALKIDYREITKSTLPGISIFDITADIRNQMESLEIQEGCVHVLSRHTTTAITINENEIRLMDDIRRFLL